MKASLRTKLQSLSERLEEINYLLSDPDVIADQNKFRGLSQEHAQLGPIVSCYSDYESTLSAIEDAKAMLEEDDPDMREMAQDELKTAEKRQDTLDLTISRHAASDPPALVPWPQPRRHSKTAAHRGV